MVVMRGSGSGGDGPKRPQLSDDEIQELITTLVTLTVKEAISKVLGSVRPY